METGAFDCERLDRAALAPAVHHRARLETLDRKIRFRVNDDLSAISVGAGDAPHDRHLVPPGHV
jgi:hypothetical protein